MTARQTAHDPATPGEILLTEFNVQNDFDVELALDLHADELSKVITLVAS